MAKVLIVEDEISIQKLIEYDLVNAGFETVVCGDGSEALDIFKSNDFDVVLLDYLLPNKTGVEICSEIRQINNDVYIILLTAVGDEESKLKAFECGADDYILKPFSILEVIARINNALARISKKSYSTVFEHIRIDEETRSVYNNDNKIELTKTEYAMIKYLVSNQGKVVKREDILTNVWGYEYIGETRTVDVYAHKLREKLDLENTLKTVRGVGFILRGNDE